MFNWALDTPLVGFINQTHGPQRSFQQKISCFNWNFFCVCDKIEIMIFKKQKLIINIEGNKNLNKFIKTKY